MARNFKVVLVGSQGSGKSSLIERLQGGFNPKIKPTVCARFYTKTYSIHSNGTSKSYDDNIVRLNIWDAAGDPKYKTLLPLYLRDAAVIVIVIDLSSTMSVKEQYDYWNTLIKQKEEKEEKLNAGNSPVIMLMGTKFDAALDNSTAELEALAKENNFPCSITSAKEGESVAKAFAEVKDKCIAAAQPKNSSFVNNVTFEQIKAQLQTYKARIDGGATDINQIDFTKGFYLFGFIPLLVESRAANRKANYLLALLLLGELESTKDVKSIFTDIPNKRSLILDSNSLYKPKPAQCEPATLKALHEGRGINSKDLNEVINLAAKMTI